MARNRQRRQSKIRILAALCMHTILLSRSPISHGFHRGLHPFPLSPAVSSENYSAECQVLISLYVSCFRLGVQTSQKAFSYSAAPIQCIKPVGQAGVHLSCPSRWLPFGLAVSNQDERGSWTLSSTVARACHSTCLELDMLLPACHNRKAAYMDSHSRCTCLQYAVSVLGSLPSAMRYLRPSMCMFVSNSVVAMLSLACL